MRTVQICFHTASLCSPHCHFQALNHFFSKVHPAELDPASVWYPCQKHLPGTIFDSVLSVLCCGNAAHRCHCDCFMLTIRIKRLGLRNTFPCRLYAADSAILVNLHAVNARASVILQNSHSLLKNPCMIRHIPLIHKLKHAMMVIAFQPKKPTGIF